MWALTNVAAGTVHQTEHLFEQGFLKTIYFIFIFVDAVTLLIRLIDSNNEDISAQALWYNQKLLL